MVKTRSGDVTFDKIDDQMPVKVAKSETAPEPAGEDEEATASSQPHESSEEKDLTYSPSWGHGSKSSRRGYRRSIRNSTIKGMSSRSLRSRYTEDDMEESRDDMMSDDSDIFPRRRGQRGSLRRTRVSSHHHPRHGSRRLQIRQARDAEVNGDKDTPEGGVRRSTRTRKQKYDSYNNTWIDGMNGHHSLRGYPSMFPDEKKPLEGADDEDDDDGEGKTDEAQKKVYVYNSDPKEASEEEEEEEQIERPRKRSRTIAELNTTAETLESGNDLDMDMYSRVKRMHRPTKRYMFDEEKGAAQADVDQTSQTSTDEETEEEAEAKRRTYSLRKTKPTIDRFQAAIDPPRRVIRTMLRRRCARFGRSRSSSSSSSEDERFEPRHKSAHAKGNKSLSSKSLAKSLCLPTPINQSCPGETASKPAASNLADVDPMSLDRSIMFAHVGGLEEHIRCLKEMVVFPMLYPEVFDRFHIQPAKGVLFHGLPGTGKTLLARALANECSQGARKVAFFMRKGADCLTKWVGESERQLRLLFDQAYQMRPSIIFFDEIDGLAPVRSSKQDQIHASIVSTLLALMDGLDSRGEVIVIGATNRVDAIDPALRRPGRFDRELYFPLPARKERLEILQIHVSKWDDPPSAALLSALAGDAAGYCGSDLRALCSEAVLRGLRRRYPQIYASSRKLLLDPQQVTVERQDFAHARASIVPAASRGCPGAARNQLSTALRALLGRPVDSACRLLAESFLSLDLSAAPALVRWPRLLVSGDGAGHGQAQTASALLSAYEHVPVHTLDLTALFRSSSCTPEEACIQVLNEARRNPPSVILAAGVDRLWALSSETLRAVFLSSLRELDPAAAVLLLATADCTHDDLPAELAALFSPYRKEVLTLSPPDSASRESFFLPVFLEEPFAPPPPPPAADAGPLEELPLAPPPPPPKLTEEQLRQTYEKEEATLRELRIFLRDCCSKLARNRLFFMFTKPVDIEEVPDYLTIIAQPMDLETIMCKIDLHRYACAQEFLDDIDLVVRNALDYNPDRWLENLYKDNKTELQLIKKTGEDKLIRHRACCLRDTAYALIKAEMDTDYEHKCRQISASRRQRADSPSRFVPDFIRAKPNVTFAPSVDGAVAEQQEAPKPAPREPSTPAPPPTVTSSAPTNGVAKRPWLNRAPRSARRMRSSWSRGQVKKAKAVKRVVRPVVIPAAELRAATPMVNGLDADARPAEAATIVDASTAACVAGPDADVQAAETEMATGDGAPVPVCNGFGADGDGVHVEAPAAAEERVPKERGDGNVPSPAGEKAKASVRVEPIASPPRTAHNSPDVSVAAEQMDVSDVGLHPADKTDSSTETLTEVTVDRAALASLLSRAVRVTRECDVETLLDVRARLSKHVSTLSRGLDRRALPTLLSEELDRFEILTAASPSH